MADSHDDKANEIDIESPAEPATEPDVTSPSNKISAEPPRWRFVGDAKKSQGYSTLAAGQYVQGKSSAELGAKYTAPDVSLYKEKGGKPEVGKLQQQSPAIDGHSKEDVEVGKLGLDSASSSPENEVGNIEGKTEEGYGLPELEKQSSQPEEGSDNLPDSPEKNHDTENKLLDDESPNCIESNNEESSPSNSGPEQKEEEQLDEENSKEGTNGNNPETPKEEDTNDATISDSDKESNPNKRHRFAYLLLLLLLLINLIVLGAILGKKNNAGEGETSAASDNLAAIPGVSVSANVTASPSNQPTAGPSILSTKEPSKSPSLLPTKEPSTSPSAQPSKSPSKQPTIKPSNAPSNLPTNAPSRKPSQQPTLPPTNLPTSKPTCSLDQNPFNVCLAVDMSGSICNGSTGFLCIGCPSDIFCRESSVAWGSCCSNFAKVKELITVIVNSLGDLPAEKSFSVVQFASDSRLVSGLSSTAQTLSTVGQLIYSGGHGDHSSAINTCRQSLSSSLFSDRKNFIVLITDGKTGLPESVPDNAADLAAESAKNEGTFIIPVVIPPDAPDISQGIPFLVGISSGGEIFDVRDYDVSKIQQLQERLVGQVSCS